VECQAEQSIAIVSEEWDVRMCLGNEAVCGLDIPVQEVLAMNNQKRLQQLHISQISFQASLASAVCFR